MPLEPIMSSDFIEADSKYHNTDIFVLSGFTNDVPRYDLLGKYNKLTNKFSFSDIMYDAEKHDSYLYIHPEDVIITDEERIEIRERREKQMKERREKLKNRFNRGGNYTRKQGSN